MTTMDRHGRTEASRGGLAARIVLALAVVLAGCGAQSPPSRVEGLSIDVRAEPPRPVTGEDVRWIVQVTNSGNDAATLRFPTNQRADVRLTTGGVDVYRWGENRAFSRGTEDVRVSAGGSVVFVLEEERLQVAPGDYVVRAATMGTPVYELVRQPMTVFSP